MVRTIEKVLNKKAQIEFIEKQDGDVDKTLAYIDKAKSLLNYEVGISFEDGIKNFYKWYEKN